MPCLLQQVSACAKQHFKSILFTYFIHKLFTNLDVLQGTAVVSLCKKALCAGSIPLRFFLLRPSHNIHILRSFRWSDLGKQIDWGCKEELGPHIRAAVSFLPVECRVSVEVRPSAHPGQTERKGRGRVKEGLLSL